MNTHKQQLKKILEFHGIKNKTELLKTLSKMLKTNPIGSIIEDDGLLVDILSIHYGRAQRGDRTAEDGRKTERSSALYAEAYSSKITTRGVNH